MRAFALVTCAVLAAPAPCFGQLCLGAVPFSQGSWQAIGGAAMSSHTRELSAGMALGGEGTFGSLRVGRGTIDTMPGAALTAEADLGGRIQVTPAGPLALCFLGALGVEFGPSDTALGGTVDLSGFTLAAEASLGVLAWRSSHLAIVPTLAIGAANATAYATFHNSASRFTATASRQFGIVAFGVGLLVHRTITIRPDVSVPIGLDHAYPTFELDAALNFGH